MQNRLLASFAFLFLFGRFLLAQSAVDARPSLPSPTGEFSVGRVSIELTDQTRAEPLSNLAGAKRRIMVYIWYPADAKGISRDSPAPYLPGFDKIRPQLSDADVSDLFRPATYVGPSSLPVTNVFENAPFVAGKQKFPLLVFSHGWGNPTFLYTAELEDIASHGYVIAAVDHPYDTAYTTFPDGTVTFFAQKNFDEAAQKKPQGLNMYARERVEVMAQDNLFAITEILRYASEKARNQPFYDRIDVGKIGAFGHSIGGLTSARTCQIDSRVLACMDQDSIDYRGSPFAVSELQQVEVQPFFLFVVSSADIWSSKMVNPTDQDLVPQRLSRIDYDKLVRVEQDNQDRQLESISGGAYRLLLFDVPDFTHRSFTDQTLLATKVDHERAVHNFRVAEAYTLAFFDKYLKGLPAPVLDAHETVDSHAILEVFKSQ